MTTVIGYCRVSTEDQAREGLSLAAQRDRITAHCVAHGLTLLRIESDEGLSASTLARAGLERARATIAQGGASRLVVAKLDRLTRSVRDLVALRAAGMGEDWALISLAENVDTTTPTGRMFLTLVVTFAEWERETTAERTRDALAYAKAQGQPLGNTPYGWKRVKVKRVDGRRVGARGELVVDVEAQAVIASLRTAHAEGISMSQLARELNASTWAPRPRGGAWTAMAVQRVLARAG